MVEMNFGLIFSLLLGLLLVTTSKCARSHLAHGDSSSEYSVVEYSNIKLNNLQSQPSLGGYNSEDIAILTRRPRCAKYDTTSKVERKENYTRFTTSVITYKILNYTTDMRPCVVRNTFKRAFRMWEEVAQVAFREATDDESIDVKIIFTYGEHGHCVVFDGASDVLAHAVWKTNDIHFDDAELWSFGNGRTYTKTYHGNSDGSSCVFPFIYRGQWHYTCLDVRGRSNVKWCATTPDYDRDEMYGLCETEGVVTFGGNGNGNSCHFPFYYNGTVYDECVKMKSVNDTNRWCSTTSGYTTDLQWGYCPHPMNRTAESIYCVFPFTYKGVEYHDCTTVDNDGVLWCSKKPVYYGNVDAAVTCGQHKGTDLLHTAVHEIGHVLGMLHSNNCLSVMYPYTSKYSKVILQEVDIAGVRHFYGTRITSLPPLVLEECQPQHDTTTPSTTTTTISTTTTTQATTTTRKARKLRTWKEICDIQQIDAMLTIRRTTFVFKDTKLWRWNEQNERTEGPFDIRSVTHHLGPSTVDAAYVRQNQVLVLFKAQQYWEFDFTFRLLNGFPKKLTNLGFSKNVMKIDGAINWRRNMKQRWTTLFVGDHFYSYDESHKVGLIKGNPKKVQLWDPSYGAVTSAMTHPAQIKWSVFFLANNEVIEIHNKKSQIRTTEQWKIFRCAEKQF